MRRTYLFLMMSLIGLGGVSTARADQFFSFTTAERAASVNFHISTNQLIVTLTNTSLFTSANLTPTHILTGVYFNLAGNLALASTEAILAGGSNVANGATPGDGVVGGEWAYLGGGPNPIRGTQRYGISSSGMGVFGAPTFPGSNLDGPAAVDGLQFGLVSAPYVNGQGNGGVEGTPLIRNSVQFTLTGLPTGFSDNDISNILFQYGTAFTEPTFPPDNIPPVPAPAGVILAGMGAALLGFQGWRKSRKHKLAA